MRGSRNTVTSVHWNVKHDMLKIFQERSVLKSFHFKKD